MSDTTDRKAQRLVDDGKVSKVGDGLYQVAASKPGESYFVTDDGRCDCLGFRYRGTCAHTKAVRILLGRS